MFGDTIRRTVRTTFGVFVFALGAYFTIRANIGLAPWECLNIGISQRTGMTYGEIYTIISVLTLAADIAMREKIGIGTVAVALFGGVFVDFFTWLDLLPQGHSLVYGLVIMICGLFIQALGQYFNISAGMGCGPRDSLFVGIGKRMRKTPIGAVQIGILSAVLLAGWLSGGKVGIGTVVSVFGSGIAMQIVFGILHFEPRNVVHQNILDTVHVMIPAHK